MPVSIDWGPLKEIQGSFLRGSGLIQGRIDVCENYITVSLNWGSLHICPYSQELYYLGRNFGPLILERA